MKLISLLVMLLGATTAQGINDDTNEQKCMRIAQQYATDNGGQPWSNDAEFIGTRYDTCLVRVSQICDQPPHERYNMLYVINVESWKVRYFEVDGCVNWP